MYNGRLPTLEYMVHMRGLIQPWSASAMVWRRFNFVLAPPVWMKEARAIEQIADVMGIVISATTTCMICAALMAFSCLVKIASSSFL